MNNPINFIKSMMGNMNPQQIAMNMVGKKSNPILANLIQMAQKGDEKGVKEFARNLYKEQGRDFDKEFDDFMSNFK